MKSVFVFILILAYNGCAHVPENIQLDVVFVNEAGVRHLYNPENAKRPLVIAVPGSGGGHIPDHQWYGLVNAGYDVLSIAYFGNRNLPDKIELIPLEHLEEIVLWAQNEFLDRKIILLGISKGAEYSLSYTSYFNNIDGLIGYSPSSFVLPNHVRLKADEVQKSSWSLKGDPLPFAELEPFTDKAGMIEYGKYIDPVLDDNVSHEKARIHVENIKCDVLLLFGESDMVWPSTRMANLIQKKYLEGNTTNRLEHIAFKDCGHQFLWFEEEAPSDKPEYQSMNITGIKKHKFLYGGTKKGTLQAMIDSRKAVLEFLAGLDGRE